MLKQKLVIGLTGGIGSGKTAASNWFAKQGIHIVDTDVIARSIVAIGSPALAEIKATFGNQVILSDGTLDRAALRQIVFNQAEARQTLENITHPRIHAAMLQQLEEATSPYVILVSALLLEGKQHEQADRVLVIDAPEHIQQARASFRDNQPEENIAKIIAVQMPRQKRLSYAHDVINNEGDINKLHQALETLHQRYLALAQKKLTTAQD